MTLTTAELETLFDDLAQAIDRIGPAQESLYLTKLVLLLAKDAAGLDAVRKAMATALMQLNAPG